MGQREGRGDFGRYKLCMENSVQGILPKFRFFVWVLTSKFYLQVKVQAPRQHPGIIDDSFHEIISKEFHVTSPPRNKIGVRSPELFLKTFQTGPMLKSVDNMPSLSPLTSVHFSHAVFYFLIGFRSRGCGLRVDPDGKIRGVCDKWHLDDVLPGCITLTYLS